MSRSGAAVVAMGGGVVSVSVGAFLMFGPGVALMVFGGLLLALAVLLGWS